MPHPDPKRKEPTVNALFDIEHWESLDTVVQLNRTRYCVLTCRTEMAYRQVVADFGADRVVRNR